MVSAGPESGPSERDRPRMSRSGAATPPSWATVRPNFAVTAPTSGIGLFAVIACTSLPTSATVGLTRANSSPLTFSKEPWT